MEKIMNEEMFDEALDRAESVEDVLEVMRSMGADVTEEELAAFATEEGEGEYTEEALENVVGGSWVMRSMLRASQIRLRHARQRLQMTLFRVRSRFLYRRW